MSVLDQAFIRAYTQQEPSCGTVAPLAAPQVVLDAEPFAVDESSRESFRESSQESFRPMLQVDHFVWPKVSSRLDEVAPDEMDALTDELMATASRGHRVVGISGCRSGEGSTTLVLSAGRRLAERGLNVVMVDANLADPRLGKRLGLLPEVGWEEALAGRLPLEEVVIESTSSPLAVLPACESFGPPNGQGVTADHEARMAESLSRLAAHYDLLLVDLGPLEDSGVLAGPPVGGLAGRLDGIVLVHNEHTTAQECLERIQRHLAAAHVPEVGIVKNFVRA